MMMLYLGEDELPVDLTPDQEGVVLRSREAAELASGEEMRELWAKYDR